MNYCAINALHNGSKVPYNEEENAVAGEEENKEPVPSGPVAQWQWCKNVLSWKFYAIYGVFINIFNVLTLAVNLAL